MKNSIQLLTILLLFISCNYNTKTESKTGYDINFKIDTSENTEIEKILKNQLMEYLIAFNGGDPEKAIGYCYPDIFIWMERQFPYDYNIESVKEMYRESINNLKKTAKEENLTYDFQIGEITNKINLGDQKLYSVVVSIIAKKKFDEVKLGDEIIAISFDNGSNWKFIQKDPETAPSILKMKFSNDIVQQIMSN